MLYHTEIQRTPSQSRRAHKLNTIHRGGIRSKSRCMLTLVLGPYYVFLRGSKASRKATSHGSPAFSDSRVLQQWMVLVLLTLTGSVWLHILTGTLLGSSDWARATLPTPQSLDSETRALLGGSVRERGWAAGLTLDGFGGGRRRRWLDSVICLS